MENQKKIRCSVICKNELSKWMNAFDITRGCCYLHPGHRGAGPRELGRWTGADHAHSVGFGSMADAQGGHVPRSALSAPHGVRGTGR